MTIAIQTLIVAATSEHEARTLDSLDDAAEPQGADRHAAREYLPMDVFIDPKAIRQQIPDS